MKKVCNKCNEEKELTEFYFYNSTGKPSSHCKLCDNEISKKWMRDNKEKYNAAKRAFRKLPQNRIAHNGRVAIRKLIKDERNEYKFLVLSGALTREKLMNHLTKTMPEGYIWDNYGTTLCIDHIKPCKAFDLTDLEQYKKCFNYKNLRLVTKSENLTKGAKYRGPGRPKKSIRSN